MEWTVSRRRRYRRDSQGRFAGAGTKVSTTAKGARTAAKAATKTGARKVATGVSNSYVSGSFTKNLAVGQGGDYKGVKVGAEFKTPKGRGVMVKGIVGVHGKPDRRLDITPTLDKAQKKVTVSAMPNPNRRASAGTRLRR
ncbi:hypothetical protein [Prescottella equi]|uniref:hypothetical protein n=1 Tax=Rhodococcus hoagii TaxID=43767 RepID=UPI001F3FC7E3|nr:hypothetical protein [Prescottella equi]